MFWGQVPPSHLLRRDGAGDLAHGVVEGQAEDLNAEVQGGLEYFGQRFHLVSLPKCGPGETCKVIKV